MKTSIVKTFTSKLFSFEDFFCDPSQTYESLMTSMLKTHSFFSRFAETYEGSHLKDFVKFINIVLENM